MLFLNYEIAVKMTSLHSFSDLGVCTFSRNNQTLEVAKDDFTSNLNSCNNFIDFSLNNTVLNIKKIIEYCHYMLRLN